MWYPLRAMRAGHGYPPADEENRPHRPHRPTPKKSTASARTVRSDERPAVAVVMDDGVGFDADSARISARGGGGLGLLGMRERVALVGGTLTVESAPGAGTTVIARVPLPAAGRKGRAG